MPRTRRTFSATFKAQAVLELLTGTTSQAELCRKYNIKPQLLSYWKSAVLDRRTLVIEALDVGAIERTTTTVYDVLGNVSKVMTPYGDGSSIPHIATTSYRYDELNRPIMSFAPSGMTEFEYDAADNRVVMYNRRGIRSEFTYDAFNRQTEVVEAVAIEDYERTTTMVYDAADNLLAVVDPLEQITSFTYDALSRRTEVRNALNERTTFVYDAVGNQIGEINARGVGTSIAYDKLNRRVKITAAATVSGGITLDHGAAVTTLAYDAVDRVVQITAPNAGAGAPVTQTRYDSLGRPIQTVDPLGHVATSVYDAADNLIGTVDPMEHRTSFVYDKLNRRTQVVEGMELSDSSRRYTTYTFDPADNVVTVQDPLGNYTFNFYDGAHRRVLTWDHSGNATTLTYDGNNNLTSVTDPAGNKTVYEYDPPDRQSKVTDALNKVTTFTYFASGTLESTIDRLGRRREFSYDALNRQIGESWFNSGGGSPVERVTYSYDAAGNRLSAANGDAVSSYTYDALNRVKDVRQTVTGTTTFTLTYSYDVLGRRTQVTDSSGGLVSSVYDVASRITSRELGVSGTPYEKASLEYDVSNQVTTITYAMRDGGAWSTAATGAYAYSTFGQVETLKWSNSSEAMHAFTYTYDRAGRLDVEKRTTFELGGYNPGTADFYSYSTGEDSHHDAKGQLDKVEQVGGGTLVSYGYDTAGTRSAQNGNGTTIGTGNRLLQDPDWDYTYDDEGNLIEREGRGSRVYPDGINLANYDLWEYSYDHANRLTQVIRKDKNAPTVPVETITYDYDADGLRVRRSWQGTGNEVTRFVYDGANVHVDLNSGGDVLVRYLRGDGVDQLFGRVTGISSSQFDANTGHWYMTDRLGSVIGIAQYNATGSDKWLRYRGFDVMPICVCGPLKQTDRYEFTGREFDHQAVLQYNRNRYYDPMSGRWLTEDPSGFGGGDTNLYRYLGNSPANGKDPSGRVIQLVEDWLIPDYFPKYKPIDWKPVLDWQAAPTRVFGLAKAVSGLIEIGAGLGEGGVGILGEPVTGGASTGAVILGVAVAAHGVDTTSAGLTQLLTGQQTSTYTSRTIEWGLERAGVKDAHLIAEVLDTGISIVGTIGLNSWRAGFTALELSPQVWRALRLAGGNGLARAPRMVVSIPKVGVQDFLGPLGRLIDFINGQNGPNPKPPGQGGEGQRKGNEGNGPKDRIPDGYTDRIGKIANETGRTEKEIREAIHKVKRGMPKGGPVKNPDVVVDPKTGEVHPKTPDGGMGDSIGNIFDHLPE